MIKQSVQTYFLIIVLIAVFILSCLILRPFLNVLVLATVVTVVFQPLYRNILRISGNREGLSATIATILIVLFVLAPLLLLGTQIFHEAQGLYSSFSSEGARDTLTGTFKIFLDELEKFFPSLPQGTFVIDFNKYIAEILKFTVSEFGTIFSSIASILANTFIFLITLYYFFKNGKKIVQATVKVSPLADTDDETILQKLELAVNSSVKGSLSVGIIQGALTSVGFALFGIPNPILWGSVAAISSLIPGIGTSLVLIPGAVFLFLTGHTVPGIGFLIWSLTAVGLIDNFLGPKIMGRGMRIPSLLVFLSVLGGILYFGPLGFLLGPLVLNLLFALLEIYWRMVKTNA